MAKCCCNTNTNAQMELLNKIDEYSFAVVDLMLFLDTHPDDCAAKADFLRFSCARNDAMKEYARMYGPLTVDSIKESDEEKWKWVYQPWPWETNQKGGC